MERFPPVAALKHPVLTALWDWEIFFYGELYLTSRTVLDKLLNLSNSFSHLENERVIPASM